MADRLRCNEWLTNALCFPAPLPHHLPNVGFLGSVGPDPGHCCVGGYKVLISITILMGPTSGEVLEMSSEQATSGSRLWEKRIKKTASEREPLLKHIRNRRDLGGESSAGFQGKTPGQTAGFPREEGKDKPKTAAETGDTVTFVQSLGTALHVRSAVVYGVRGRTALCPLCAAWPQGTDDSAWVEGWLHFSPSHGVGKPRPRIKGARSQWAA